MPPCLACSLRPRPSALHFVDFWLEASFCISAFSINTFAMLAKVVLLALAASASAFVAAPALPASRAASSRAAAAVGPSMVVEHVQPAIDATQLLALGLPIPALNPEKALIMMFCNILIICTMSIQGKGLSRGTPHDEMVESFGITW